MNPSTRPPHNLSANERQHACRHQDEDARWQQVQDKLDALRQRVEQDILRMAQDSGQQGGSRRERARTRKRPSSR